MASHEQSKMQNIIRLGVDLFEMIRRQRRNYSHSFPVFWNFGLGVPFNHFHQFYDLLLVTFSARSLV